jgi:HPt (histidine-containing phosphotransfer) domain-containing protein
MCGKGETVKAQEPTGAVDFGYLEDFAAGDRQVISEVLMMFQQQALACVAALDGANPGWRDVVHTIKGSARGIGANVLGEVCANAEIQGVTEIALVRASLAATVADIAAYQARSA